MSGKDGKRKNLPLPSILSNIRNAGKSSMYTAPSKIEMQSLIQDENVVSPTNKVSALKRVSSKGMLIFDKIQNIPLFDKANRPRFRRRDRRKGFKVELPPKFLLYTIFVFIVLPLIMGIMFIVRQITYGKIIEDEEHPLHKKTKHIYRPLNQTMGSNSTTSGNTTRVIGASNNTIDNTHTLIENDFGNATVQIDANNITTADDSVNVPEVIQHENTTSNAINLQSVKLLDMNMDIDKSRNSTVGNHTL
ncbi:predicted protein [Chaetoceros tenuissimus]|uniref:Uncharacterized protein n=1 Tax=Chaetoceros tenuissimus TaxID=426638 RepID=A0AAD3CPN9_9STRA|nr:predicted protein [Chaetoceros tenuissimus]